MLLLCFKLRWLEKVFNIIILSGIKCRMCKLAVLFFEDAGFDEIPIKI